MRVTVFKIRPPVLMCPCFLCYHPGVMSSLTGLKGKKIAVGISGGVDSSVAAALLLEQGLEVIGVHMVCYDEEVPYCTAAEDKEFAIRVAARLNIPLKVYDFRKEYQERVIDCMVREYQAGRTPNPDIVCNREIKFGLLFEKVFGELGVDFLATGHYVRVGRRVGDGYEILGTKRGTNPNASNSNASDPSGLEGSRLNFVSNLVFRDSNLRSGRLFLVKGADSAKDQSYFLYSLTSRQISKVLFPVGGLLKREVRSLAAKFNLPTKARPDSQGLCFVGKLDMTEFLADKVKGMPGEVVTSEGIVVGVHKGLPFYTIGQRHGFQLDTYFKQPLYVIDKIPEKNQLVVGARPQLQVKQFEVLVDNWVGGGAETGRFRGQGFACGVRIRHLGKVYSCRLTPRSAWSALRGAAVSSPVRVGVVLEDSAEAVAPGQIAVFYEGEKVLGGGVIERVSPPHKL